MDFYLVKQMMEAYGQDTPLEPVMPDLETRKLRALLMLEETLETIVDGLGLDCGLKLRNMLDAIRKREFHISSAYCPSLIKILDGGCDVQVVTLGTQAACGLPAHEPFREVMRSNMTKFWSDKEVEQIKPKQELTVTDTMLPLIKKWRVKDKFGKIVKSPSYSPAHLETFCIPGWKDRGFQP